MKCSKLAWGFCSDTKAKVTAVSACKLISICEKKKRIINNWPSQVKFLCQKKIFCYLIRT